MALPKLHRLRQRKDFSQVYREGKRRSCRYLTLRVLSRWEKKSAAALASSVDFKADQVLASCLPTRIGVSISQKVSKRAVVRNRLKRQVQSALYQLLPRFPYGWDLVVIVHPQAVQCDYFKILQELEQLLIDAEVLNGH